MRTFSLTERVLLANVFAACSQGSVPLRHILEKSFFNEASGRALILRVSAQLGYLYLRPSACDNGLERHASVKGLIDLMTLVVYLRSQGLVVVYDDGSKPPDDILLVGAGFGEARANKVAIVLNAGGDFTLNPEVIQDRDGNVIYKGLRLTGDLYNLVAGNVGGTVYATQALKEFVMGVAQQAAETNKPEAAPLPLAQATDPGLKKRWRGPPLALAAAGLAMLVLVAGFYQRPAVRALDAASPSQPVVPREAAQAAVATASSPVPAPQVDTQYGIDLSRWNPNMEAPSLEADSGIAFVFLRATEGVRSDPAFSRNWRKLQDKGVVRGAYHFYMASVDPIHQAKNFLDAVGPAGPLDIVPTLDFEESSLPSSSVPTDIPLVQNNLLKALAYVEARSHRVPMIYTDVNSGNKYLNDPRFSRFPLWIADWTNKSNPTLPAAWKSSGYKFWQRTSRYTIKDANKTPVDLDIFRGSKTEIYR